MEHFGSSSLIVCKTQKLPLIVGSPSLKPLVDKAVKPVLVTRASPIPVQWDNKIKADFYRNVVVGVIEQYGVSRNGKSLIKNSTYDF